MDPKLFDAHNALRAPREIAEDVAAALRAWDTSYEDAHRIASGLDMLRKSYTAPRWADLNGFAPLPQPKFPCAKFALEIFQVLKLWAMTHAQMSEFCGRVLAVVEEKGPKDWKAWKPDIRPNFALPGVGRLN